jgi:hypothetical protein
MTDPASAIRHQIDVLMQLQITTLGQHWSLTPLELSEYHERSAKFSALLEELDATRPAPLYRVPKCRGRLDPTL